MSSTTSGRRAPLPVLPAPPAPLRADAARNRERLLAAAGDLFGEHGIDAVTLDDVVATAGVGKGTLYRIFGDKSGLGTALLDELERGLQERILHGTPPLGPGADPVERAEAFVRTYVRYVAKNVDLVRLSQTARYGARFDTGAHQFWRAHLAYLATEAGARTPQLVADVLLAAVTAEQVEHWTRGRGVSVRTLERELTDVVRRLLG